MYDNLFPQNVDQPGEVISPARGQLNRENEYFSVPVCASKFGLAKRVRPSRPASACSFCRLRLNLVLTHGIPLDFLGGIHLFVSPYAIGPSRVYRVAAQLRADGIHCQESAGTRPVVLKIVQVTCAAFAGHHGPINVRLSFPTPTLGMKWAS